ncbi:PhzF family phenazine biosynthesis isomerase [Streptomyces sp. NPDC047022]|uniref:PhzF family phenazine biosynthesis protein n=1 Tax=Streptomyces sp. NPDC047022 TaxID=3155737 RepID=UPI0033DE02B9
MQQVPGGEAFPTEILRYTAFTETPDGGNPAGVVLNAASLSIQDMQAIAAEVGYSETAFLTPPPLTTGTEQADPTRSFTIRYFSPLAEVPFCGHATIATAIALGERIGPGELEFRTRAGTVPVAVTADEGGRLNATLTSVEPHVEKVEESFVQEVCAALSWRTSELDPALEPRIAYAGARHLILAAATRERLADLEYDFAGLKDLMLAKDLTTVQLVWRETGTVFHARDPFPVGGVVEDPATGAAAAAFGAYTRELGLVSGNAVLTIHQGADMGRPSTLTVHLRDGDTRIRVSGTGTRIR